LQDHQLFLKKSKCVFGRPSVAYLGHIISADGVAMDGQKVQAVLEWPRPKSVRAVRGFLGLAGYYRRFIRDFGVIAAPLTALLRKEGFRWNDDAEHAFGALQRALTTPQVLQLPDFERPFIVECDASGSDFGAVLHQGAGPIAIFSSPSQARGLRVRIDRPGAVRAPLEVVLVGASIRRPHRLPKPPLPLGPTPDDDSATPVG
jgi:hypothetical protein